MNPSFSLEDFLHLLSEYNTSTWIPQVLLYMLAILAVRSAVRLDGSFKTAGIVLAVVWVWVGVVFHYLFFRTIAENAWLFSGLSVAQAGIFLYAACREKDLQFRTPRFAQMVAGGMLITYALVLYPVVGWFLGHIYPRSQTLGAPCPATTFTLGILLWLRIRPPWWAIAVPILWALVASLFAIRSGVYEDIGLFLAGIASVLLLGTPRISRQSSACLTRGCT